MYVTLAGATLSLKDCIYIKYLVTDPVDEGTYAKLYYEQIDGTLKEVATVPITSAVWDSSYNMYAITYDKVPAKEMTRKLRIEVYDSNDQKIMMQIGVGKDVYEPYYDYTVATWALNKIEKNASTKEVQFAKALLNYGKVAQEYFAYNLENMADSGADISEISSKMSEVTANEAYSMQVPDAAKAAGFAGALLKLESAVNLDLLFSKDVEVKVDGSVLPLEETQVNGKTYWHTIVTKLPTKNLHELHTIEVGGTVSKYGVLSWANRMFGKTSDSGYKNDDQMARALYLYNKFARLYLNYDTNGLQ